MNMLVIGNGFDLAHGRPTKYEDFLKFSDSIMRTKTFSGDRIQFQRGLNTLTSGVKSYVLQAFDDRIISLASGQVFNNNSAIQEIYDLLIENSWYQYFDWILKENRVKGKDWVDFESEIREVIDYFDHDIKDIYEMFPKSRGSIDRYPEKINEFYKKVMIFEYNESKKENRKYIATYSDFIQKTYQDLQDLVRCLEIYLDDCIGGIPLSHYSPDIRRLEIDSVLSFNYTAIPTSIYKSLTNTHYIHGYASASRPAIENNMVLGVNEYWSDSEKDSHTNFNLYKKFVQRIIKETGIEYKKSLEDMIHEHDLIEEVCGVEKRKVPAASNNVYIFGHSLDITDGDILREIIQTEGVATTIFYRNKQQQANQIANLSKVLGQKELLDRTFSVSPTIIFKQQADMEKL